MVHPQRQSSEPASSRWIQVGLLSLGLLVPLLGGPASGAETAKPTLTFNGYGTLGLVHSSEDQADFLGGLILKRGAGHASSWSAEVDSRVAAQLDATFNSKLSAVVQMVAEQQADGTYRPHLEWANVSYRPTPNAVVRVGRTVWPTFMISDYRRVGYVNPWVRPPVEVYSMNPLTSSDGIDGRYTFALGGASASLEAGYGQSAVKLTDGEARARNSWGLRTLVEHGPVTVHASYHHAAVTIEPYNRLFDAFRQFGPEGVAIARRFDADGRHFAFGSVGAAYDPGAWFVMGEAARLRSHSALGDNTAWYVSGGVRRGPFTPYLTYAQSVADSELSTPGLTVSAYPPELAPTISALNGALNALLAGLPVQSTVSVGVRWDFRSSFDLKLQLDRVRVGRESVGTFSNLQPGYRSGGTVDLVSCALDFVF